MATQPHNGKSSRADKLQRLPHNAKVSKRPLPRPAIASPHADASHSKIVYVSSRTPFLSAVKRVEKLLRLAEKRLVQSATELAKQQARRRGGKRNWNEGEGEINEIAAEVERQKRQGRKTRGGQSAASNTSHAASEQVVVKGTGKAIAKVMDLSIWFQERADEYMVELRTGTVAAIDDIDVPEEPTKENDGEDMDTGDTEVFPETRIRNTSILEARISLR